MTYCILALDGGGLRGQFSITVLRRLEEALPGWIQKTDLFAGTSIGAVLALGLANGSQPGLLEALFRQYGPEMFRPSKPIIPTVLRRLFRAGYSTVPLNRLFEDFFGDVRLEDLSKRVVVPAFRLDNEESDKRHRRWEPVVFHNLGGASGGHGQTPVSQVILYATATPTLFPAIDGYVDGGLVANNPSLIALAYAEEEGRPGNGRTVGEDIVLLSIGTGYDPRHIEGKKNDWGYLQWRKHLFEMMSAGSIQLVDHQCRQFLNGHYHRLCPALPEKIHANDKDRLEMLIDLAESADLTQTITWLEQHWLDRRHRRYGPPFYSFALPFLEDQMRPPLVIVP